MPTQVPVTIRYSDPRAGYLAHQAEIDDAIRRVLQGGEYILGPEVDAFEEEFGRFIGIESVVSTGNGTDAIALLLRALGIGSDDIVVTTSNTAVATVAAIELAGANAFLVDVDDRTLTMSPGHLEGALRSHNRARIKAVIVVHLYGQPADLDAIEEICRRHDMILIEDCAQAHGALVSGRLVGTWGLAAAFSFYPTKNLGALGDGGAIATKDQELADSLRELRIYGWKQRYVSERPGMNTRLDSVQAAILRVKLRYLEQENTRRSVIAARYDEELAGPDLRLPARLSTCRHVFHQYVVRTKSRDALREHLLQNHISAGVLYPTPIHLQPAYRGRIASSGQLSVTEQAAEELLCLPIHPWLSDEDVDQIVNSVRTFFSR